MKKILGRKPNDVILAKERSFRLKVVRMMTGLTANEFAQKSGILNPTYWRWERGDTLINQKMGHVIIETLTKLGVKCSLEWLLNGNGDSPKGVLQHQYSELTDTLANELELFMTFNANAVATIIEDNLMEPFYSKGDRVAGIKLFNNFQKTHNKNCIVEIETSKYIVRKVTFNKEKILLITTNQKKIIGELLETPPISIALIIFHRKNLKES